MGTFEKIAWGGIFSVIMVMLISGSILMTAGCQNLPQKPYTVEEDTVWEDGTMTEAGKQPYIDSDGKGTNNAIDPETGEPNEKATIYDNDKIKSSVEKAEETVKKAPTPWSEIGLAALGLGATVLLAWTGWKNRGKIAKLGGKPKEPEDS